MLQEDIREMFISEGVVTATGHRMCRMQKENQGNAVPTTQNSSSSSNKKDESPVSSKSIIDDISDSDVSLAVTPTKQPKKASSKSRSSDELNKSKRTTKSRKEGHRVTRQRVKKNPSSESEDDRPLAFRTNISLDQETHPEADNEEQDTSKRSKRLTLRDTIKDSRVVVEKTDINKTDTLKVMFDSSSDESFGIDVAELAAAVDISLHPEKQTEPEIANTTPKKQSEGRSSKKTARRNIGELLTEDNDNSDGESMISNISSLTKKTDAKKLESSNEKLLSDILIGLVPTNLDKKTAETAKHSDVEDDLSTENVAKKSSGRKKKKSTWKMGIVCKRKRKRTTLATPSPKIDDAEELENTSVETTESSAKSNNSSKDAMQLEEHNEPDRSSAVAEAEGRIKDSNDSEVCDILSSKKKLNESRDSPSMKVKTSSRNSTSIEEDTKSTKEARSNVCKGEPSKQSVVDDKTNLACDDIMDKVLNCIDINTLVDYAWTGQERYKCLICFFTGKNIVHHYKLTHPGKEILISRLAKAKARKAIREGHPKEPLAEVKFCKFTCRFCNFLTEGETKSAMEAFYEHCTTHTGEYRHRCNSCPYQAVAKSSMKTHYYKVCRKFYDTCVEAITEDDIPVENSIYGFMCSTCNFVQLKRPNLEKHVEFWHRDCSSVNIVKINMSTDCNTEDTIKADSDAAASANDQVKEEVPIDKENSDLPATNLEVSFEENKEFLELESCNKIVQINKEKSKDPSVIKSPKKETKAKSKESKKSLSPLPTGKLSVFVCPPELEKKEEEIEQERKRKMQEIVDNIGIKLQKNVSRKGISIIDKLKDKMTTNLNLADVPSTLVEDPSVKNPDLAVSPATILPQLSENPGEAVSSSEDPVKNPEVNSLLDKQTDPQLKEGSTSATDQLSITRDFEASATDAETTGQDPLLIDEKKHYECETETSDNDNTMDSSLAAPNFESDSSSEQSDVEPPTDVNMLLKETSSIKSSSRDPIMTTIQRLAAQLQAANSIEKSDSAVKTEEGAAETTPAKITSGLIPKPPNVVPIATVKRFLEKLDAKNLDLSPPSKEDDEKPAKNFIRLRRLSGDMLSEPSASPADVSNLSSSNDGITSHPPVASKSPTDELDRCSFLQLGSVVSLAPGSDKDGAESLLINDIRKAVETSPTKKKAVSVLKKSNTPIILKKVTVQHALNKNIQAISTSPPVKQLKLITIKEVPSTSVSGNNTQITTSFVPIAPKTKVIQVEKKVPIPAAVNKNSVINQAPNVNYKIVKMQQPVALKLKTVDAYNAMLKVEKLSHLYKCMARNCHFSTDSEAHFNIHYNVHYTQYTSCNIDKDTQSPFDFQKCAYCYHTSADLNQMKQHMDTMHAHCRYQCSYCFYRAAVPSYVQMHQTVAHPGFHGILLGKLIKDIPAQEEINRSDFVHPYVCQFTDVKPDGSPKICRKFFYVPEAFVSHLNKVHGTATSFKCHLCKVTCPKPDHLLGHYKTHNFFKFQCLYCIRGSATFIDMHIHLSANHYNRLPQVLERMLPDVVSRDVDVLKQLILRTFDDPKNIEDIIELEIIGTDKVGSSPAQKTISPILSKETILTDKDENAEPNKSISESLGTCESSHPNYDENIAMKSLSEKLTLDEDWLNSNSSDKNLKNPWFDINPEETQESALLNDQSCEFFNPSIFEDPDLFKSNSMSSNDVSFNESILNTNQIKSVDSDIEIVDFDVIDLKTEKKNSIKGTNKKEVLDEDSEKEKFAIDSKESETKESLDAEGTSSYTNATGNSRVPMTLDDIKDTGVTGTKLYKCGFAGCTYAAPTPTFLRNHISLLCPLRGEDKNLNCAHCGKRFIKVGFLLEHLKVHGLKRFGCALCNMRYAVGYQAMAHMKSKHKFMSGKLVPADPKNPWAEGLFIVQAKGQASERKGRKRKGIRPVEKDSDKSIDAEKLSFSPNEIGALPRQAIYNREVQCAVCPYKTKVRTNIIRHLQLHAMDQSVPESGPVNPVPCLDKKERMFDKMVNLASSSHQNGRMGAKTKEPEKPKPDKDEALIPKYVPLTARYVCCVPECTYLTHSETMLRHHFKALHFDEPYFRCPHCPQPQPGQESLNIAVDKMAFHLKMHDTRLYKCSHCNHHHFQRHIVERHLTDKHPDQRTFVKVIRELEDTDNNQPTVQEENEEEVPDPDGNHWKCNICDYKSVYKAEMVTHAATNHDEKCQFKCTLCPFKTIGKIMLEQHITSKHSNDSNPVYELVYQRIKGVKKITDNNVEQITQEEPFDTTPLWRRDMPRIRHIRGILLEEDNSRSESSSLKLGKRKSDGELNSTKPPKIRAGMSCTLDDGKQSKEKSKVSLPSEKIPVETESTNNVVVAEKKLVVVGERLSKDTTESSEAYEFDESDDFGQFGPYGVPEGNMYVCTLCGNFKTKYKHDMKDHMYRDLNYMRWKCLECGYLSVNRNSLVKHFHASHPEVEFNYEPISPQTDIESWVSTVLKRQTNIMRNASIPASSSGAKQVPTKLSSNTKALKPADLAKKISSLHETVIQKMEVDSNDEDSRDNALVIDIKEDVPAKKERNSNSHEAEKAGTSTEANRDRPLICKHCKMRFNGWRGFKLHVQLTHLKRFGFLCPYCDRSTNSESLMRQHIRAKHPGSAEKIVPNPDAGGPELSDEFWEKEYGIVFPKRNRKRKRAINLEESPENDTNQTETQETCPVCGFVAMNYTGLKVHMRIHGSKNADRLSCTQCTFTTSRKTELWQHWEVNHPNVPLPRDRPEVSRMSNDPVKAEPINKYFLDDGSYDIVEERVSSVKEEFIYSCFYCSFRNECLGAVNKHWSLIHKDQKPPGGDPLKAKGLPFKYRENGHVKDWAVMHRSTKEPRLSYEMYMQQSKDEVQIVSTIKGNKSGWICQWCNELCESEVHMKSHQNMYHSHLPLNFKKEGPQEAPKGYTCPECPFTTTFFNLMKNHALKHIENLLKCKHCDLTCGAHTQVSVLRTETHREKDVKKIDVDKDYDDLVDRIMERTKWSKDKNEKLLKDSTVKRPAVAKKSTARSTVPISPKVKSVARKSTNPHSRHLANVRSYERSLLKVTKGVRVSHYGLPVEPINELKVNTIFVIGGQCMRVNIARLKLMLDIQPNLVLHDLKHDAKYAVALSKFKSRERSN